MPLPFDAAIFRAVVSTVVPESQSLAEQEWRELEAVVEALLRGRPEPLKRRLKIFLKFIDWLPVVRFGRRFARLNSDRRRRVLEHLQDDRVQTIRVGFWGLRTIVLAGYYGRPGAAAAIG